MKLLRLRTPKYNQYIHSFRAWLQTLGYAASTVAADPNMLKEFFYYLEKQGIITLEKVTAAHPITYIEQLKIRKNQRREGALSLSHINSHIDILYKFSQYIKQTKQIIIPVNLKRYKEDRKTDQVLLTVEETKQLYGATDETPYGMRDRAMLALYYGCGLRKSEGINLDVSDILFDRKLLYIRKAKNNHQRYVPITVSNLKYLEQYIYNARPIFLGEASKEAALLISERGRRTSEGTVYLRVKALQHKAHISKEIGLHTLRHSIATHLLQNGMELENIALFLGHRCLDSTQIYTHIVNESAWENLKII